ncbi:MAG: type II toxin-antitoxin system CcdA family antitoxin [Euzebyaceae bacterium]|jgi:antitoxin CcdA|nr:type II toxin-antitoxin system CcdA family antitoxin [Euzebyaceae bacterium]
MPSKRKVSLSLDADLVDELEHAPDEALSAQVNSAIRAEVQRRRRHRALRELLNQLDDADGPLTADDEAEIDRYRRVLES